MVFTTQGYRCGLISAPGPSAAARPVECESKVTSAIGLPDYGHVNISHVTFARDISVRKGSYGWRWRRGRRWRWRRRSDKADDQDDHQDHHEERRQAPCDKF